MVPIWIDRIDVIASAKVKGAVISFLLVVVGKFSHYSKVMATLWKAAGMLLCGEIRKFGAHGVTLKE